MVVGLLLSAAPHDTEELTMFAIIIIIIITIIITITIVVMINFIIIIIIKPTNKRTSKNK